MSNFGLATRDEIPVPSVKQNFSLTEQLEGRVRVCRENLAALESALAAVKANPELQTALDLLQKVSGIY